MTCPRSVYPWDIVVEKVASGALFFDKRDNSQFDYLTVCETSNSAPSAMKAEDDPEGINTPERLALEATMINQNFSQQIVKPSARTHFDLPNPFFNEDDNDGMEAASVGYRYRRFDLGGDIQLVCRTELHGVVKKKAPGSSQTNDEYMTSFALNEHFDSITQAKVSTPFAGIINWREKLDAQRGAVLATELKNNAFKLAKWTCQSILADAQQMKIGFVSRTSPKSPNDHQILATQFYRPKEFAQQITLNEGNMWGIFRIFVDIFRKQPEGKYVVMRDPNKAQLRIFRVPVETFETDE
jgi:translation initiation factor 3 subunit D